MTKQLVDVVEALLLVALAIGALFPAVRLASGREPAKPDSRPLIWATIVGAFLGLAMIVVHHHSIIRFNRQGLTLTTLEPTVVLGILTLVLVWIYARRTLRALRQNEGRHEMLPPNLVPRIMRIVITSIAVAWTVLIVFRDTQMVYMQTLTFVPVGATVFSTVTFLNVLGYIFGLVLVVLAGVGITRLCQILPGWTLPLLTVFVLVITASHTFLIIRLLHAIRVFYLSPSAAIAMSWLINHENWFVLIPLAVTALASVWVFLRSRKFPIIGENPARKRARKATAKQMTRRSVFSLATAAISVVVLTVGARFASAEVELSEPEPYDVDDKNAIIPLSTIDDGHLHRFVYETSSGVEVRWIVIQKAGSSYGVGLDACEICGPSGYYEKDGQVICKLCSVAMNIATIGFKGGCNPIPIKYEVANNALTIPLSELEASAEVFS